MAIFDSTASYYSKYRLKPSMSVIDELKKIALLDGNEVLLDLGSGPGTLPIVLSQYFRNIIAVDISQAMIEEGKTETKRHGLENIAWINSTAESISIESIGKVDVVTFGNSFHWMNQELILDQLAPVVMKGGAILGGGSSWNRDQEYDKVIITTIKEFVGERKTTKGKYKEPQRSFKEVIDDSPFEFLDRNIINYEHTYSIEDLIGLQLSTSYANETLLGDRKNEFVQTLRERLESISNHGKIVSKEKWEVILFRSPSY